jgi:predicted flap endonuclease-1-like 5' DNA nuclease
MKDDVAPLESQDDRASNDAVTGVRKTENAGLKDTPTEEIEIESVDLSLTSLPAVTLLEEQPRRRTSIPPPLPAEALRLRRSSTIPPAADLKARLRPPTPIGQRTPIPIGAPPPLPSARSALIRHATPAADGGSAAEAEALTAEIDRLSKRMRERDAYLAELEQVYAQRSEALLAAEAKLEAQQTELDVRAARIAELEAKLAARTSQPLSAAAQDDLTRIRGIGPHYARLLEGLGVASFATIAAWTPDDCTSFARLLKVNPGRVERDRWVEQARALCEAARATPPVEEL